ncbi:TspO/MBR family protein [uncultured Rubinisphaera sp.]|uniref:TspO/MBR family protein n=1 Tax=uncultured Rubinisphaera sp. TaxID=1678686 RepID=UPI0030DD7648
MNKTSHALALVIFIALSLSAGGLGAIATTPEIDGWYKTIEKPSWNPPGCVFGSVWTTLYVMMAVAAWLVWKPAGFKAAKTPLNIFALQFALNVAESWVFFPFHQPGWVLRGDCRDVAGDRGNNNCVLQELEDGRLVDGAVR